MDDTLPRQILIAGAGIAGMTAALAFSRRGFSVQLFEKTERFEEIGAGLQLSPNATAILRDLGVLGSLKGAALRPEAVVLRGARSLREATRIPLGDMAEARWGAPYLVVHRADLMSALASHVSRDPDIRLVQGAAVRDFAVHAQGVTTSIDIGAKIVEASGRLLIGADGVWSSVRGMAGESGRSLFSGNIAWRATIRAESDAGRSLTDITGLDRVTAFMHPTMHLIVYPIRDGEAINLVAVTKGAGMAQEWGGKPQQQSLQDAMNGISSALASLVANAGPWTAWPLHTVDPVTRWTIPGGVALIGDAAHAMTPFAAQGAAMAIEDAATLASKVAGRPHDLADALASWEQERRKRVAKVVKRGALNHYAWHASGPVAVARDLFLKTRSPNRLAADLDWLYGWKVSG